MCETAGGELGEVPSRQDGEACSLIASVQIPEQFGAVRTIADMEEEELLVGTTRNAILRGTFSDGFVAIVQVC